MIFQDRKEGGEILAERLAHYRGRDDAIVLALPRGGVPVAFQVAKELRLPLDIIVVRKLALPGDPEAAFGAIASGGELFLDQEAVKHLGVPVAEVNEIISVQTREVAKVEQVYRGHSEPLDVKDRDVILIDDGLATGATMRVAIASVRKRGAKSLAVGVPVGPATTCNEIKLLVDEFVCTDTPARFSTVSQWYQNYRPVSDENVKELLAKAGFAEAG